MNLISMSHFTKALNMRTVIPVLHLYVFRQNNVEITEVQHKNFKNLIIEIWEVMKCANLFHLLEMRWAIFQAILMKSEELI